MRIRVSGALLALALGCGLASSASAQRKPTIAIMPAQYFSADADSAAALTRGLAEQFERQGYTVVAADKSQSTFQSMGLSLNQHYPDRVARRFGSSAGADLVAYPRLLALGVPMADVGKDDLLSPAAVVHLRVLNVHTGAAIYFRQISHEFSTDVASSGEFKLPDAVASSAAGEATTVYFQRVAGSRKEFRVSR